MPENLPEFEPAAPLEDANFVRRAISKVVTPIKEARAALYYWTCEKLGAEPNPDDLK